MSNDPSNLCQQRAIALQNNEPLTRFTPVSPYVGGRFTKMQLDMRRKVEILKYNANKSSSQTNNLTKKQSYALLARGSLHTPSQTVLLSNSVNCAADNSIPTPSSSSDVPGQVVYLYEDRAVPLYNYSGFNARTYPEYNPGNKAPWKVVTYSDVSLNSQIPGNLFYLIVSDYIDKPIHTYDVNIPVGISISGTRLSGSKPDNIYVSVQYANLSVYYNNGMVTTIRNPGIGNSTGLSIGFDVSNNSAGPFRITQYLGNLGFNQIRLFTSPTYVYSFLASFALTLYTDSPTIPHVNDLVLAYFGTGGLSVQVLANMSPNTNSLMNCHLSTISNLSPEEFNAMNVNAGPSLM